MAVVKERNPQIGVVLTYAHVGDIVSPITSPSEYYLVCKEFENARVDHQGAVYIFLVELKTGQRWTDSQFRRANEHGFYIRDHELLIG